MRRHMRDIAAAVLKAARDGSLPTPLMLATKTNYKELQEYLKLLNAAGLVERKGRLWFTTEEGLRYLALFEEIQKLEEPRRP